MTAETLLSMKRYGEVHEDWRTTDVTPVFRNGRKDELGNSGSVHLTLNPGKMVEQFYFADYLQASERNECDEE